ncbi:hypothetical protein GUITHDRAFT_154993, partial [Guillardia theta CCMP2712]
MNTVLWEGNSAEESLERFVSQELMLLKFHKRMFARDIHLINSKASDIKPFHITAIPKNQGTSPLGLSANKFYYTLVKLYGNFPRIYQERKGDVLYQSESIRSTCLQGIVQMAVKLLFLAKICGREIDRAIVSHYLDSIETSVRNAAKLQYENLPHLITCTEHSSTGSAVLLGFVDSCLLSCRQVLSCITKYGDGASASDNYVL